MTNNKKILVVEDNDFVRLQIVSFLKETGDLEVFEVSNGNDALELFDNSFSLVVVDVRMEPMGGFEFVRTIRSMGGKTAVIMVTGDDGSDILGEIGKWDIGALLMKPIQKDRLIKSVEKLLRIPKKG